MKKKIRVCVCVCVKLLKQTEPLDERREKRRRVERRLPPLENKGQRSVKDTQNSTSFPC